MELYTPMRVSCFVRKPVSSEWLSPILAGLTVLTTDDFLCRLSICSVTQKQVLVLDTKHCLNTQYSENTNPYHLTPLTIPYNKLCDLLIYG